MTALRVLLVSAGVILAGYGAVLLWGIPTPALGRIGGWALAGVVVHDLVFAPLCAAVGVAGRTLLPVRWRSPAAVAALCSVVLVALAVPVYTKPGLRPDNPTVLDRDYVLGLWLALAVVWVGVPLYALAARRLPVGQDEVVDRERTDDIEGQPPAH
ncbi:hypothetical protein ACNUDN_03850 [Mycobacterium sp. smrl_JER01]|uniref:hypothetical protein n=1 Tax=Mycobacterium sp. smrl_JER01 TaxID=3402633 RepID=UPI003AC2AFF3